MNINKLNRRLTRLKAELQQTESSHREYGEMRLTYWAGYNLGYLKGKIVEIEDMIDELAEDFDVVSASPPEIDMVDCINKYKSEEGY